VKARKTKQLVAGSFAAMMARIDLCETRAELRVLSRQIATLAKGAAAAESRKPSPANKTRVRLQRTGSETDAEVLSEATLAMKEWWDKCWQTSPCMCAALRPTDFFKMGYLAGRRANADKSQNG